MHTIPKSPFLPFSMLQLGLPLDEHFHQREIFAADGDHNSETFFPFGGCAVREEESDEWGKSDVNSFGEGVTFVGVGVEVR